jgi:hypothetical protein
MGTEITAEAVDAAAHSLALLGRRMQRAEIYAALEAALPHLSKPLAPILEAGSSDYEVWRDAWHLASQLAPLECSPLDLRDDAESFFELLKTGPPPPPKPDCPDCGADSSMDHDDHCSRLDQAEIDALNDAAETNYVEAESERDEVSG